MTAKNKTAPLVEIDVTVDEKRWEEKIPDLHSVVQNTVEAAILSGLKTRSQLLQHIEVSIVLADNALVQDLNKRYRNKDKPTNVLSFPQTEKDDPDLMLSPFLSLGDIIIALETVEKEAQEQSKSFESHARHLLVHGCLHLLHYDHESEEDAEIMESLEISILKTMNIKNPYQTGE